MTDASFTSQPVKTWAKRNARLYDGKKIWSEIRTRFVGEFSTKRMEKQAYFSLLILFTSPPSCVKNGVRKIPANRPPVVLRPAAGCGKQAKPTNLKRNNMTKLISKIITLSAFAGLVAGLSGCRLVGSGPQESVSTQPRIKSPPEPDWPLGDQVVELGTNTTFKVNTGFMPWNRSRRPQWYFNGYPIDSITAPALGVQTDGSQLRIDHVSLTNCGFYIYQDEESKGSHRKSSSTAELLVFSNSTVNVSDSTIRMESASSAVQTITTVFGTPIGGQDGSGTAGCPGPYKGYVRYPGYFTFANGGTATDGTGAQNPVVYYTIPFATPVCGATVPDRKSSELCYFYIFFKNSVPPGPYPLRLTYH